MVTSALTSAWLLIDVMASRSVARPSVAMVSPVVVTLMTAGTSRSSSCSRHKGSRRRRRALRCAEADLGRPSQVFMVHQGEEVQIVQRSLHAIGRVYCEPKAKAREKQGTSNGAPISPPGVLPGQIEEMNRPHHLPRRAFYPSGDKAWSPRTRE